MPTDERQFSALVKNASRVGQAKCRIVTAPWDRPHQATLRPEYGEKRAESGHEVA
jgi:hypothetical protein